MRRADFFLALADQDNIDGQFPAGRADGVQGGEEGRFRAFLVDRAAAHDRLAETGPVDNRGFQWRGGPFGGVELLDVIHEIDAKRPFRACVQGGEDARVAIGRHDFDMLESGVFGEFCHILRAFGHIAVFGCDRGQCDPVLNPLDRGIASGFRGLADRGHVSVGG